MVRLVRCDVDEHDSNVQIMFASSPTEARHVNTECTVGCVGCVVDTSLFFFFFFPFYRGPECPEQADRQSGGVSTLLLLMDMSSEKHLAV